MMTPIAQDEVAVRTAGPLGVLVARARNEPARTRLLPSFVRFMVTGVLSVGTDFIALYLLHSVLHVALALATLVAYAVSLVVNYTLNHSWVFQAGGDHRKRLVRYGLLVAVNVGSNLAFVLGLTAVGVYYLVAKTVAIAVNAAVNFGAFRYWVFR